MTGTDYNKLSQGRPHGTRFCLRQMTDTSCPTVLEYTQSVLHLRSSSELQVAPCSIAWRVQYTSVGQNLAFAQDSYTTAVLQIKSYAAPSDATTVCNCDSGSWSYHLRQSGIPKHGSLIALVHLSIDCAEPLQEL